MVDGSAMVVELLKKKLVSYALFVYGAMALSALGFWLYALQASHGITTFFNVLFIALIACSLALTGERLMHARDRRSDLVEYRGPQMSEESIRSTYENIWADAARKLTFSVSTEAFPLAAISATRAPGSPGVATTGTQQLQFDAVLSDAVLRQYIWAYLATQHSKVLNAADVDRLMDRLKSELAKA